ncbi:hypothetical protein HY486_03165 [Candidatus Woesearchaeota archaeon]|nr:hypothetical protein [Candidatus Woesearchaeota archaeon]
MKLTEANKEQNRRFHELPENQREDFLLKCYSQVFATDNAHKGEFTPPQLSPETISNKASRYEMHTLNLAITNLNFLMTRMSMLEKPKYEEQIRELALLKFEYMFLTGKSELTQNPQLAADFFLKRRKQECIRPALERMGEDATDCEYLAEKTIDTPVFQQHVGKDTKTYKFRTRLHAIIEEEDCDKKQAARMLMSEGFDLIGCDFNRWYKFESDSNVSSGEKQYRQSPKEKKWLDDFVAQEKTTPVSDEEPLVQIEDDEEDSKRCKCSKKNLITLDKHIKDAVSKQKDKTPFWIKELSALTSDHAQLSLKSTSHVEANMWDYIWGGEFYKLAKQLKGANPDGRTRRGLNYNRWALTHKLHKDRITPILAQDAYAMIIAGDILVGDLKAAVENLNSPELKKYTNLSKIKAAVNLAWEVMQKPGKSDDTKNYQPPAGYLYRVASHFEKFLRDNPGARTYINLISPAPEIRLGEQEETILASITDFDDVERVFTKIGRADKIKDRFLEIFDQVYDHDTEFMSIQSEIRAIVEAIQHKTFRKYINDKTITQRLLNAIDRTLHKKSKHDPERDESGSEKSVLTLYQNPVLHPYLKGKIDVSAMVNGMIDDIVDRREELLTKPLSLRHDGELDMVPHNTIEAYMLADKYRDSAKPQKLQKLVAYLLALNSEMTINNMLGVTSTVINSIREQADASYQIPEYFPDENLDMTEQSIEFLSKVYTREKKLGGLNPKMASIAVTNVIFRGTYAQPGRFYPQVDSIMAFLDSPLAELLPTSGLGHEAIKEYKILHQFLRN